jgi:prolyl oligopeptidase PreP (S9A serine peptidase family)
MYGYSPYHHVQNDMVYPAVWIRTGADDGRVSPASSWEREKAL